jgi:hypothetical protein
MLRIAGAYPNPNDVFPKVLTMCTLTPLMTDDAHAGGGCT